MNTHHVALAYLVRSSDHHGAIPTPSDLESVGICTRQTAHRYYREWRREGALVQPFAGSTWARGPRWSVLVEHLAALPPASLATGHEALALARTCAALRLHKHADPIDGAREITIDEAEELVADDPALVWGDF